MGGIKYEWRNLMEISISLFGTCYIIVLGSYRWLSYLCLWCKRHSIIFYLRYWSISRIAVPFHSLDHPSTVTLWWEWCAKFYLLLVWFTFTVYGYGWHYHWRLYPTLTVSEDSTLASQWRWYRWLVSEDSTVSWSVRTVPLAGQWRRYVGWSVRTVPLTESQWRRYVG